ncbi:O-methyltransferase-domain-containing protein [Geopyxis carbonaria]|nr:O-methyltransferase-domain-containing protein [Geopyxis carbonaria]
MTSSFSGISHRITKQLELSSSFVIKRIDSRRKKRASRKTISLNSEQNITMISENVVVKETVVPQAVTNIAVKQPAPRMLPAQKQQQTVHTDEGPLSTPAFLKHDLPITTTASETIERTRRTICEAVNSRVPHQQLAFVAVPLDPLTDALSEFIAYIHQLTAENTAENLLIIPHIPAPVSLSRDVEASIRTVRALFIGLNEAGVPVSSSLDGTCMVPHYLDDLLCAALAHADGGINVAHLVSGAPFPVGFLEDNDGSTCATAAASHSFVGLTGLGMPGVRHTKGNSNCFQVSDKAGTRAVFVPSERLLEGVLARLAGRIDTDLETSTTSGSSQTSPSSPASSCSSNVLLSTNDTKSSTEEELLQTLTTKLATNVSTYLQCLTTSGLPGPSFEPTTTPRQLPSDPTGLAAQRTIIHAAEAIIALTAGPAGLYGISRQFFENTAIQIAVDLDLATLLPLSSTLSATALAAAAGADATLLTRVMRALTPLYIFTEVAPSIYAHTARSATLRDPNVKALMSFGGNDALLAAAHLPATLAAGGYRNPTNPAAVSFCTAYDTPHPYFTHVFAHAPAMGVRFTNAMAATVTLSYEVGSLADLYPWASLPAGSTIVDVGGGRGQVMRSVAARFPAADLHFVIQDLADNVAAGEAALAASPENDALAAKFSWAPHDFFDPQPVRGAAVYFLRHILHDWPDAECKRILAQIVPAMVPGVSRLLVCDMVVPPMGAPKAVAHRDLLMMAHLAGMERTREMFEGLFRAVDSRLVVEKVWKLDTSGEGGARILEVVLRE